MSNLKQTAKRVARISENELVDLVDGLLAEAIVIEKQKWIAEQAQKDIEKTKLFESRLAALEKALIAKK